MVFGKPVENSDNDKFDLKLVKGDALTKSKVPAKIQESVLRMQFVGANKETKITTTEDLSGKRNYLSDKENITDVSGYGKINYKDLYDGIGASFYSNNNLFEYDLIVSPEATVDDIRIKFEGASNLSIKKNGDLSLIVSGEEICQRSPKIYQETDGKRKTIEGKYIINANGEVGFEVGFYDKKKLLVIDPIISYSTYLGGNGRDFISDLIVDKNGNSYVTGNTFSPNFPTTSGTVTSGTPSETNSQIFVSKFDASGNLIFSTFWGGSNNDEARGITLDSSDNIFVGGYTQSVNYPTTTGAFQTIFRGSRDSFVTKLNSTGTAFVYSTLIGGDGVDYAQSICADAMGNLFVGGQTGSNNFPTTPGVFQPIRHQSLAGFITKLNPTGSALVYSTYLSGMLLNDFGSGISGIAIDTSGNAIVTGSTANTDFPTTSGVFQQVHGGSFDGFVTKINMNASAIIYSTLLGGTFNESPKGISIDAEGNAYVAGDTNSANFPVTLGVLQTTLNGGYDAFITKLNATGSALIFSTYLGGSEYEFLEDFKIDSSKNVYVSGSTRSANFPTTADAFQTTFIGASKAFLTKINPTGNAYLYSTYFGGSDLDAAETLDLDNCGNVYLAGTTFSTDFPTRQAYQATNRGPADSFITKFSFISKVETAPDASASGSLPVTVSEYKLPAAVDTEILDYEENFDGTGMQPLKIELWASVYRPATLSGSYPLLIFLHGNHGVCERNATPVNPKTPPPTGLDIDDSRFRFLFWYAFTGSCDNPNTTFNESLYYDVVQNHQGYDYLGQKLASLGYIVISINANRGIHIGNKRPGEQDRGLILARASLILRHLEKLKQWNDCTTNPNCQTPATLGVDLRGKLDFSNVGFFGHSRGGQAVRAAYNLYKDTGYPWQSRIPGLSIKGVFEVGPTDFETQEGLFSNPASKFVINGTKWNILLPMCDGDVTGDGPYGTGMNAYDRMLLSLSDGTPTQKSTYIVWGANHNFYNTIWNYHDINLDTPPLGDFRCFENDPLWEKGDAGSVSQRQTAFASVVAFFKGNVGNTTTPNFNQNFNPLYEDPSIIQKITRVEKGFTPSPNSSLTKVFEDFSGSLGSNNCSSGSNTCTIGGAPGISTSVTRIGKYHDESLKILNVNWTSAGSGKNLQINWRAAGIGADISDYQTFDFRISRTPDAPNIAGATNFSIQLVMANGSLSNTVKLCNYAYVDGPVGGYEPIINSKGYTTGGTERRRPYLQTVRIPLTAFINANLSQIRGVKITFDESSIGTIFLANLRFTK